MKPQPGKDFSHTSFLCLALESELYIIISVRSKTLPLSSSLLERACSCCDLQRRSHSLVFLFEILPHFTSSPAWNLLLFWVPGCSLPLRTVCLAALALSGLSQAVHFSQKLVLLLLLAGCPGLPEAPQVPGPGRCRREGAKQAGAGRLLIRRETTEPDSSVWGCFASGGQPRCCCPCPGGRSRRWRRLPLVPARPRPRGNGPKGALRGPVCPLFSAQ